MGEWESEIVIVATGGVPVNGERRKAIFINPSNEMNYERLTNCHLFPHRGRVEKGRSLYDHPTPPSLPLERLNCEQLEDVYAGTLERTNAACRGRRGSCPVSVSVRPLRPQHSISGRWSVAGKKM